MGVEAPPELVRELAAVPRSRFVAERTARAKALRADGQRDEATAVGKLRKPSPVTWAVNAAARDAPDAAAALVAAVRRMQEPGEVDVRATTRELDARLDELVEAGAAALGRAGERVDVDRRAAVRSALRATALAGDPDEFVEARLTDAVESSGDATLEAALLAGSHGRAARRRASSTRRASTEAEANKAEEAARGRRRELQAQLRDARRAHATADDELRAARRALKAAERAQEEAAAAVTELQARLAD